EDRHYAELVLRLIDAVDLPARVAVAKKIAVYPGAPPAVARRLARDAIEVAEPILKHCNVLTKGDHDAIVRDFGAAHEAAIASRRHKAVEARSFTKPARPPQQERGPQESSDIAIAELFFSADPAARRT